LRDFSLSPVILLMLPSAPKINRPVDRPVGTVTHPIITGPDPISAKIALASAGIVVSLAAARANVARAMGRVFSAVAASAGE
jgi:hypothetical protein